MRLTTKRIRQIAMTAVVALLMLTGCSDFLTETNKSSLTNDTGYESASQAQAAVDGIYENLRTFTNSTGYGEAIWVSLDLLVGHANTNGQSDRNREFINHQAGTDHPVFSNVWDNFYNGTANANLAIANIPDVDMDQAQKDQLLGEAHFLRAFYYYHLVRLYGEIPLITEPVDANSDNLYPEETSVDSIYTQIVSDLKTAEQAGLPGDTNSGRVSQGAVKSLLSSVYLTMAGHPLEKGDEYYQLAADKAEEVIDSGWYTLFEDYTFLHDREHKNQGELILQAQYEGGIATNGITALSIPENENISTFGDEFGSIRPVNEFIQTYEEGDKRMEEKEFYFTQYTMPDGTVKEFNQHALWKYWLDEAANPATGDQQGDINWTLLRLPEVMMIYAEATNELNGPTPKAYDQVNAIRERADLDPLSGLSQDQFRQAIWKERYHELNYENKAYFDIQRTHMVYDLENNTFVDAFTHENVQGTTFNEQYLLWAIPNGEMQANPELTQNPGWGTAGS
jgi:hypothetical protein